MNTQQARGGSALSARFPLRWWDLSAAVMLVVQVVLGFALMSAGSPEWMSDAPEPTRALVLVIPLLGLVALYLVLGRSVLRRTVSDAPFRPSGHVFMGLFTLLMALAVFAEPMNALLQALAYPMAWTIMPRYRDAVVWSAVISLGIGAAMFAGLMLIDPRSAALSTFFTVLLSFSFAVAMGTWINRIFERGEEYREMAERLRRSRTEVAVLSEAAGASAERERLSRELHDTLTQTLTGLVMLSEQAERALASGQEARARDRLARVGSAAREAAAEARALVATTQPLGDGGLIASIERVAARLREDTGLEVECDLTPIPLDREREVVLLRAVQEGLANARKHARASAVRVSLSPLAGGGARLLVDDDGTGPRASGSEAPGFGLSGLAERTRMVGGTAEFGPRPGGSGSRLDVILPAEAEAEAEAEGEIEVEPGGSGFAQESGSET